MNAPETFTEPTRSASSSGKRARWHLDLAVKGWFAATALGQMLFVTFILLFYYRNTIAGNFAAWDAKQHITGYLAGDTIGNANFAAHVLVAAVMTSAGLLQLVPAIRMRWPRLHRWSGRIFIATALFLSIGGLWLTWVRGSYLAITSAVAISIDGALIIGFGIMAWWTARQRNFAAHRRWAMRTFIVASGVWFMRLGYMVWGISTGGLGIARGMSGPFDIVWGFATYLLPLAVLELYLRAERGTPAAKFVMAGGLWVAASLILAGGGLAWMVIWSPHI